MASYNEIEMKLQAYLDGELGEADRTIVERRLRECPDSRAALEAQQACSAELFETLTPFRLPSDLAPYIMEHLPENDMLPVNVEALNRRAKHPSIVRERLYRIVPALVAMLLVALALVLNRNWPDPALPDGAIALVTSETGIVERIAADSLHAETLGQGGTILSNDALETAVDGRVSLILRGSTRIRVAEESRLRILDNRTILLEKGKALFEVSRGKRLFRVSTDSGLVTVYGTTFEVNAESSSTVVTVAEGEVTLAHLHDESVFTTLRANEQGRLDGEKMMIARSHVDAWKHLAWADAIHPEPAVEARFLETFTPVDGQATVSGISGANAFFVLTQWNGEAASVGSVLLEWVPSVEGTKHCAYQVIVRADGVRPLFQGRIPGSVFDESSRSSFRILNTSDTKRECTWVQVDIYPDYTDGTQEVRFKKECKVDLLVGSSQDTSFEAGL